MKEEGTAPDGTEIHVTRNHGKPTRAQELAKALAEARKAKNAKAKGKQVQPAETINAPAAAPSTSKMEKLAKEGLKPADPDAPVPAPAKAATLPATRPTKATKAAPSVGSLATKSKPSIRSTPDGATEHTETTEPRSSAFSAPSAPGASKPVKDESPSLAPQSVADEANPTTVTPSLRPAPPVAIGAGKRKGIQVRFTGMKPLHVVEAALFAAGKPITVEEIAEQTGLPPDKVKEGIKDLQAAYADRDTILEVGKAGTKWAMQVRSQAAEPAAKFAPMEIAPKLLKTLALIAFHQPMKQSQLVDMMGTKVYDHIPELVSRGLVRAREEGVTKILGTTPLFPEYFGLDASDPDEIRALMGRLVGIVAPPKPKVETVYEDPQPQEPESTTETPPTAQTG